MAPPVFLFTSFKGYTIFYPNIVRLFKKKKYWCKPFEFHPVVSAKRNHTKKKIPCIGPFIVMPLKSVKRESKVSGAQYRSFEAVSGTGSWCRSVSFLLSLRTHVQFTRFYDRKCVRPLSGDNVTVDPPQQAAD